MEESRGLVGHVENVFYCKVTMKSFKGLTKGNGIIRLQFKKFGYLVEKIFFKERIKQFIAK